MIKSTSDKQAQAIILNLHLTIDTTHAVSAPLPSKHMSQWCLEEHTPLEEDRTMEAWAMKRGRLLLASKAGMEAYWEMEPEVHLLGLKMKCYRLSNSTRPSRISRIRFLRTNHPLPLFKVEVS